VQGTVKEIIEAFKSVDMANGKDMSPELEEKAIGK
jgi:hypothetical protein